MHSLLERSETAANSISFSVLEAITKISKKGPDCLFFGEVHPKPSIFSPEVINSSVLASLLVDMDLKPAFIGVDLSSLDPEKLNENGKIYLSSIESLIQFAKNKNAAIIALGDQDREIGTQDYEVEMSRKIKHAIDEYGSGVCLAGAFHCRKKMCSGSLNISPAAKLLSNRKNLASIRIHQLSPKDPGAKIIDAKQQIAYQDSIFVDLYPDPKKISRPDLYGAIDRQDFDGMILIPTETSRMNHQWGSHPGMGISYS